MSRPTEKQLQCLIALYGTSTLHGMTASEVGVECGQPKAKASAWACPKLFALVRDGYIKEDDHGYHITGKGESAVDEEMPQSHTPA
jgi:hypothetical protein